MRWYVNEASLQGQFQNVESLSEILRELLEARAKKAVFREGLKVGRLIGERMAVSHEAFRQAALRITDQTLRVSVLTWIDRAGPFFDGERLAEADDYFECLGQDVTDGGLGEAARRLKAGEDASAFSFAGGGINFAITPLNVQHGIPEDVLGVFPVGNIWRIADIRAVANVEPPAVSSWRELVVRAREKFPKLWIPDSVFENRSLAREPFDSVIRDRAMELLGHLNEYAKSREDDGSDSAASRQIIEKFFTGDRALFSGESQTNRNDFESVLTFDHPEEGRGRIFAHWHGKISHRFFRLHFEWPVPAGEKVKIVYLGPKLTKR